MFIEIAMSTRDRVQNFAPESIYLDLKHTDELTDLLWKNSWISDEILSIEKPGEGNMNFVVRVKTNSHSIIIKQSRPWVEKYPQIAAPVERVFVEAAFYKVLIHDNFYREFCPTLIGFDEKNFLLALEDLGTGADCTFIYQRNKYLEDVEFESLVRFLSHLHNTSSEEKKNFPNNAELKKLNHTHIFHFPYLEENGFDLDSIQPGLQKVSLKYKTSSALKDKLKYLGDLYLQEGNTLIHGDYYPGSWLKTKSGIKIIDPEFSHYGHAEFDLGVMVAHLKMAHTPEHILKDIFSQYVLPANFSIPLFSGFCGAEIMRRIIGLAQLPLDLSLPEKTTLLDEAEKLILYPQIEFILGNF